MNVSKSSKFCLYVLVGDIFNLLCYSFQKVLEQHLKRLNFDLDNVVRSCEFVDNVITFGNEAEFMDVKYLMLSRLHQLKEYKSQLVPEENDIIKFMQNNQILLVRNSKYFLKNRIHNKTLVQPFFHLNNRSL